MIRSPSSRALTTLEPSNKGNEKVINSPDIPLSNPTPVAADSEASKQGNEEAVDVADDQLSEEEEPQNQLGDAKHYRAYYGHGK